MPLSDYIANKWIASEETDGMKEAICPALGFGIYGPAKEVDAYLEYIVRKGGRVA